MKLKKILRTFTALAVCSLFTAMSFAQSTEYTELLEKAKTYESNKEYFYAFATYYDAMLTDPANASDALSGFRSLKEAFENGKPGKEKKYNQFTLHDGYESLIKNCDKYWTENYNQVYTLAFNFTKGSVDYKTRTAEYNVNVIVNSRTQKFYDLMAPISSGLEKAWVSQWEDIPKRYPLESYHYTAQDTYAATKIATYNGTKDFTRDYNYSTRKYTSKTQYRDYYEASWIASEGYYTYNNENFMYSDILYRDLEPDVLPLREYNSYYENNLHDYILADIRYRVVDLDGNEIIPLQPRHMLGTDTKDTIKGVNANAMQCIDDGEFRVEVVNLYLPYGKPTNSDVETSVKYTEGSSEYYGKYPRSRKFVTSLSEINYAKPDIKTFTFNTELSDDKSYTSREDTMFAAYRKYNDPAEQYVATEINKKFEESYVPVESDDYIFIKGDVISYSQGWYSDSIKTYVPGFYICKETLKQNQSYYYDSEINTLAAALGTSPSIIHKPDSKEMALIEHYYPGDFNSSYIMIRSRESLTEDVLKKEMAAPRFTNLKKSSSWTVYKGLEKSFRFSLEGKNLTKNNAYVMLGDEQKIMPAEADGNSATFDIPVEILEKSRQGYSTTYIYFYTNDIKYSCYWDASISNIEPEMESTTLSLSSSSRKLYIRTKNNLPSKSDLKILVDGNDVYFDISSRTLTISESNFTQAGEYKVELYYQENLAKSWDITVTE